MTTIERAEHMPLADPSPPCSCGRCPAWEGLPCDCGRFYSTTPEAKTPDARPFRVRDWHCGAHYPPLK